MSGCLNRQKAAINDRGITEEVGQAIVLGIVIRSGLGPICRSAEEHSEAAIDCAAIVKSASRKPLVNGVFRPSCSQRLVIIERIRDPGIRQTAFNRAGEPYIVH